MTAQTTTTAGRREAEAIMTDTCTITRVTGETLNDNDDLVPVTETIYTGKCRLRFEMNRVQARQVEGQLLVARMSMLFLPYDASAAVQVDDLAALDQEGFTVRIAGLFSQTYATARRFPVEAIS